MRIEENQQKTKNKQWNLEELKKLSKGLLTKREYKKLKEYFHVLVWKIVMTKYHIKNYEYNVTKVQKSGISNKKSKDLLMEAAEEVICIIQIQHSLGDILVQIINVVVLDGKTREKEEWVTFNRIVDKLKGLVGKGAKQYARIYSSANALKKSKSFKYISAFSNTVKHRRLIRIPYRLDSSRQGLAIKKFVYRRCYKKNFRKESYSRKWCNNVVKKDIPCIDNHIAKIGKDINKFLKTYKVR